MAWTTSDTRYKSAGVFGAQELSYTDSLMQDDSILNEQVHLSDDEDFENNHLPKADSRKDWWKPLSEEERPATPKPAWIIPSSNVSAIENKWASALVSTYETPAENSLLAKTRDMTTFMNCSRWRSVTRCSHIKLTGQIRKETKLGVFKIWQQRKQSRTIDFQDEVPNMASPTGGLIDRSSILKEMILRRVEKKLEHTCGFSVLSELKPTQDTGFQEPKSIDFEDLNLLLLQGHLDHLPGSDKRMLYTTVKLWTQKLVIRQRVEDFQLGIESYQTQLNLTKPGWDATGYEFKHDYTIIKSPRVVVFPVNKNERKIMRFNEIYKFSDGTLTRILEALDYRVKEFKTAPASIYLNLNNALVSLKALRHQKSVRDTNTNYACSSHTMITSKILRVLRIILVVLPEHPSDTKVLSMKMEILLEPTSNKFLIDQAWVKCLNDHLYLRAPTAHDMQILIKTCLMPLALKTRNDSLAFVHELKKEMHANLKYVESFENEIEELESDKA
ncbi:hypothetical protein Tco_0499958 [Tanacetum coccineum]